MKVSSNTELGQAKRNTQQKLNIKVFSHDRIGIIRMPVYPITLSEPLIRGDRKQLCELVRQLLNNPVFLEAVYIASPSLHEKAVNWLEGDVSFPDIDLAIARYALRMAHRPTPFGTFSSVAAITVGPGDTTLKAPEVEEIRKSVAMDYSVLAGLAEAVVSKDPGNVVRYRPNDTITQYAEYISYLRVHGRPSKKIQHVEQLERNEVLDFVLEATDACGGMTVDEITTIVSHRYASQHTEEEIREFIHELRAQEVLVADSLINPTASEQLTGFIDQLATTPSELEGMHEVASLLRRLAGSLLGVGLEELKRIRGLILEAGSKVGKSTHVVAFSRGLSGSFSQICMRKVELAIDELAEFVPRNDQLTIFKERFVERFGEASVPMSDLLPIFDTMGYPDGIRPVAPLADRILAAKAHTPGNSSKPLNEAESYAVSMLALSGSSEFLDISEYRRTEDGAALAHGRPSCLVAWLALWADDGGEAKIELKSCGAQEPGRLMGRFSGVVPEIFEYLNEVEAPRDNKVFAQIVGVPASRAGNIISRPATASPEIRLRAGGAAGDIMVADLEVFVANDRVVLWSKSRKVEIVPRMNAAHSIERCKGAASYVFLNHVANQDHICRMPSLRAKLQDAPFLPGLTYKGMIVERPSWRVTFDGLGLSKCSDDRAIEKIRAWAQAVKLPEIFEEYGKGDSITFSLISEWMAKDFLKELRKKGALTLACAFPLSMLPFLRCSSGPRMHEIQVALRNNQMPHRAVTARRIFDAAHGDAWVYVCTYCKAANQNAVISSLYHVLNVEMGHPAPFFFIRYRDKEGEHVRVRVKIQSPHERSTVTSVLEGECKRLVANGAVHKFVFKPYMQEIERYLGPGLMQLAEEIFVLDSRSVIRTFGKIPGGLHENWRSAAVAADALLRATGLESLSMRLDFARVAAADFQAEMAFNLEQRKLIGDVFKKSKPIFSESGDYDSEIPCLRELTNTEEVRRIFAGSVEFESVGERDAYRYRWSLVHMRFNRIFTRLPRVEEAICWELLKRSYLRCRKKMEVEVA